MEMYFLISGSEILDDCIEFKIEWNCPFLPRIGELINPSIVSHEVTPERFRTSMTNKAGLEWDKQIAEGFSTDGLMAEWIVNMSLRVTDVSWWMDGDKPCVTVFLMEEAQIGK